MRDALVEMLGRLRSFFLQASRDSDVSHEFASHLELATAENIRNGLSPDEARRQALLKFGGLEAAKEIHREARGLPSLESFLRDLRYALRVLKRDAGFTLFAILIVGLGIAGSTIVFSVFNTLLIRPLPFKDAKNLVWIANNGPDGLSGATVEVNPFLDLKNGTRSFSQVAGYFAFYGYTQSKLLGQGEPEFLTGVPVTGNFFQTLGVTPQYGRLFSAEECKQNGPKAIILGHGLWQRRFAGDPGVIGRVLTLDNQPTTVIGVMPGSFDFASVFAPGTRVDFYSAFPLSPETDRWGNTLAIVARLKSGISFPRAVTETTVLCAQASKARRSGNDFTPLLTSLSRHVSGELRPALIILAVAVAVVMLIVCANLSNLLLARTAARQKELAVRAALGAARKRLMRQLLTESLLLAFSGAALGLALTEIGAHLLNHLSTLNIPLLSDVRIDLGAFTFLLATALITGFLFGIIPALQVRDVQIQNSLQESTRGASGGRRHTWIRNTLVISEIAFACLLLIGAGLLIRSLMRVLDVHLGFQPERAMAVKVDTRAEAKTPLQKNAYFQELLQRVRAIPGVQAAGLSDTLPLGTNRSWTAGAKGVIYTEKNPEPAVYPRIVSDGYLKALGIELKEGRDLRETDGPGSKPVVLVNETMARALWPGQTAIGKFIDYGKNGTEVVGVVGDVRHLALEQASGDEMYLPARQVGDSFGTNLVVRSSLPENVLVSQVRSTLRDMDRTLPLNEFRPLQQWVDRAVSPRRFIVMLLSGFAVFALILASLGVYAVISYSVTQRTQEIGIRLALGESAGQVQRTIVWKTLSLAGAGMLFGALSSWMLARALTGLLFGITAGDPITFTAMLAVLAAVAALAGYIPAFRASRTDPMTALRVN
jgi:predicted permease